MDLFRKLDEEESECQSISHASFLSRLKVYQKRLKHDDIGVVPVPKFHSVRSPKKDIRAED